jgi:hypothetical protein
VVFGRWGRAGRRGRAGLVFAVSLLLGAGGLVMAGGSAANASTTVVAVFSSAAEYVTPVCSHPGTYPQSGSAVEVYNPCGTRVWVHYYSGSSIQPYCVNPGGGLAYDLPISWQGGDTSDLQITTNTNQCDSGNYFAVNWFVNHVLVNSETSACQPGRTFTEPAPQYVGYLNDGGCDFRIWLHGANGTSPSLCFNGTGDTSTTYKVYYQAQSTNNQAPCDAGGPPYPY